MMLKPGGAGAEGEAPSGGPSRPGAENSAENPDKNYPIDPDLFRPPGLSDEEWEDLKEHEKALKEADEAMEILWERERERERDQDDNKPGDDGGDNQPRPELPPGYDPSGGDYTPGKLAEDIFGRPLELDRSGAG